MRSLHYLGPRQLAWRDVTAPTLQADTDALVRPIAASICDLDRFVIAGGTPFSGPFPIGHECVAEIVDIGDDVDGLVPGDVVAVPWHVACGTCARCRNGLTAHCDTVPYGAMYGLPAAGDWGGTFDELVRVPWAGQALVPLPPGTDPLEVVSAGDNLSLAVELLGRHLPRSRRTQILVLGGGGSTALYAVDVARALGAAHVSYLDPDPHRSAIASRLGAEALQDQVPAGREFDLVFDSSFDQRRLRSAFDVLAPEAVVESSGIHFEDVALPLFNMYVRGVTFHTARANARTHLPRTLDMVVSGRLDPSAVLGEVHPIQDAAEVLVELPLKPVFTSPADTQSLPRH